MSQYNRVEFTMGRVDKPKVLAFVECTWTGISFGQPKRFIFTDYTPPDPSENYERTTIHKDGKVVAHFNFMDNTVEQRAQLDRWSHSMCFTREFYDVGMSDSYLANPKSNSRTKVVAVQLIHPECKIWFAVVPSLQKDVVDNFEWFAHPAVQCWRLSDSWPVIVIGISNVKQVQGLITLDSVGLDYRESQPQ